MTCTARECERLLGYWTHHGAGATREEAIANMHAWYDAHPGRRRLPSREAHEVYRAVHNPAGWLLYVRHRRRDQVAKEHGL